MKAGDMRLSEDGRMFFFRKQVKCVKNIKTLARFSYYIIIFVIHKTLRVNLGQKRN